MKKSETLAIIAIFGIIISCILIFMVLRGIATNTNPFANIQTQSAKLKIQPTVTPTFSNHIFLPQEDFPVIVESQQIGRGLINDISADPSGELLAVGDETGFWVLDLISHEPEWISYYAYSIEYVSWSPDGLTLATYDPKKGVIFWDSEQQSMVKSWTISRITGALSWSPDSSMIALIDEYNHIRIWDVNQRQEINAINAGDDLITSYHWISNDELIIKLDSIHEDRSEREAECTLVKWNIYSGKEIAVNMTVPINVNSALSDDHQKLALIDQNAVIGVFDINNLQALYTLDNGNHDEKSQILEDLIWEDTTSEIITLSADGTIQVWEPENGALLDTFEIDKGVEFIHATWSDALSSFVIANHYNRIYKLSRKGETQEIYNFGRYPVNNIDWSPDGTKVALGLTTGDVSILDTITWQEIYHETINSEENIAVLWSPDNKLLATVGIDNSIKILDITSNKMVNDIDLEDVKTADLLKTIWSPDVNSLYVISADGNLNSLNVYTGEIKRVNDQHFQHISSVAWSPDGNLIAYGGERGWIVKDTTEAIITYFPFEMSDNIQVQDLAWSPDGKYLALIDQAGCIRVYETKHWKEEYFIFQNFQRFYPFGRILYWWKDSNYLVTNGYFGESNLITFWDVERTKQIKLKDTPLYDVVEFSPDRKTLIIGSQVGILKIFNILNFSP